MINHFLFFNQSHWWKCIIKVAFFIMLSLYLFTFYFGYLSWFHHVCSSFIVLCALFGVLLPLSHYSDLFLLCLPPVSSSDGQIKTKKTWNFTLSCFRQRLICQGFMCTRTPLLVKTITVISICSPICHSSGLSYKKTKNTTKKINKNI